MIKISGLIIAFIGAFTLLSSRTAYAATGCCEILRYGAPSTFETLEELDCSQRNTNFTVGGVPHIFRVNEISNPDSSGCIINPDFKKENTITETYKPTIPELQVSVPGFKGFTEITCDKDHADCGIPWLAEYIRAIYNYGLIIIGILSVIVMMIGGVIRITAGGNHEQIGHANTYIKSSVLGIIFAVCSYIILFLINPNLVILSPLKVGYIEKIDLTAVEFDGHDPQFESTGGKPINDSSFDTTFKNFAGCIGIDWRVLKGIAYKESHLNPSVVNKYGFTGLFQTKNIYCEESVRVIGLSSSFCSPGVKDPAVNTAVATGMMKVNLGTINAKCSSVSDAVKIFMIYYGHSSGGGALKKAINAHGCNINSWPASIFKGATKTYVTETVETVLGQGVSSISNTTQNGKCPS